MNPKYLTGVVRADVKHDGHYTKLEFRMSVLDTGSLTDLANNVVRLVLSHPKMPPNILMNSGLKNIESLNISFRPTTPTKTTKTTT